MTAAAAPTLLQRRCANHPQREASARCPECRRYYCRECITEHDDRVLCASCLAKIGVGEKAGAGPWFWVPRALVAAIAFLVLYLGFDFLGRFLLSFPSTFHPTGGW